jgi:ABC-type sugar transport system substrate-binding protein
MPLIRLRKLVVFDRFLARLVELGPDTWLLKGGLVLQLRLSQHARTTKDMDLLSLIARDEVPQILTRAALFNLQDGFSFAVRPDTAALPGPGHGGQRFFVTALVAGRAFESFHIDVGSGDPVIEPAAAPAPTAAPTKAEQPTAAPAAQPTTAPAAQPTAAPAASAKPLIAGVVFQSDTFMQTVQAGMQAAADELGAEMIMGNTDSKLDKEASLIDDYIIRGVKAIIITPISVDGSIAALKRAKDAGIIIFCFNTCVSDKTIPSGFLVTKNSDLGDKTGAAAVKFITEKLGGKAKIGMLNCDQYEACVDRKAGFLAQVKTLPGVEVVADQAGWLADKAQPVSEAMLQAHPDINLLWAANEGGTVAHANAVKTQGLGGKVYVFSTDMNNQMGQMLQAKDDILQGVTGQAPYQMGYDSLKATLEVLGGKTVEAVTNTPTIYFGRGNDALIKQFMDTEGNAIFK